MQGRVQGNPSQAISHQGQRGCSHRRRPVAAGPAGAAGGPGTMQRCAAVRHRCMAGGAPFGWLAEVNEQKQLAVLVRCRGRKMELWPSALCSEGTGRQQSLQTGAVPSSRRLELHPTLPPLARRTASSRRLRRAACRWQPCSVGGRAKESIQCSAFKRHVCCQEARLELSR